MRSFVFILLASLIGVSSFANLAGSAMTDPPRPPRVNYPSTICPGDDTSIDFILVDKEPGVTYIWNYPPSLDAVASESADGCTLTISDITLLGTLETIFVNARNTCGQNFTTCPVRIVTPLTIPEIPLDTICTGDGMLISPLQTTRVRSYEWNFGAATDWELATGSIEAGEPFSVRFNSQGLKDFSVTITDNDGCLHTKSYKVQVFNAPPNPFIQCNDGADVITYEWTQDPAYTYIIDYDGMQPNLVVTEISDTEISVAGFNSPCQFAILKIIVVGDNPAPCNTISQSLPCRPSPKPTIAFDFRQKNFCLGDAMTVMDLIATVNNENNPTSGVWTFDPLCQQTAPDPGFTFNGRTGSFDPNGLPVGEYKARYVYTNPVDNCESESAFTFNIFERALPNATLNGTTEKFAEICGGESVELNFSIYEDAPPPSAFFIEGDPAGIVITAVNDSTKTYVFPEDRTDNYVLHVVYDLPDCEPVIETVTINVLGRPDLELECGTEQKPEDIDIVWADLGVPVEILVNNEPKGSAMGGSHTITQLQVNRDYEVVLVAQTLMCGEVRDTILCSTVNCIGPDIDSSSLDNPLCGDPVFGVPLGTIITPAPGTMGGYTWDDDTKPLMLDATPNAEIFKPIDPLVNDYTLNATWVDITGCRIPISFTLVHYTMPEAFLELDADTVCVGEVVTIFSNNVTNASEMTYDTDFPAAATIVNGGMDAGPYELTFDMPGNYDLGMQLTRAGICQGPAESRPLVVVEAPELNVACRSQGESSVTLEWVDVGLEYTIMQDVTEVGTTSLDSLALTGLPENETFVFTVTATDPYCGTISGEATCVTFACADPIVVESIPDTICFDPLEGSYLLDVSVEADIANGGAPGTFEWSTDLVDSADNFTPEDARQVDYTVTGVFSDTSGCTKNISFDFIFVQTPEMVLNVVGSDTICAGTETLTVVGEFNGTNVDATEFVPDFGSGVTIVDNPQRGTYELSFEGEGDFDLGMSVAYYGCEGLRASTIVNVKPKPDMNLRCADVENEAVNLEWDDLGVDTYEIKQDGVFYDQVSDPAVRIDNLMMNEVYEYIVETITDCGLISDTIKCQTFVCPPFSVDLSNVPSEICHSSEDGPFLLDVEIGSIDPDDLGAYEWDSPLVDDNDGFTPEDVSITDYTLDIQYTDKNGCDQDTFVSFIYTESPRAQVVLTSSDTICIDGGTVSYMSEYIAADMSLVFYEPIFPDEAMVLSGNGAGPYELSFTEAGVYTLGIMVEYDGCPGIVDEVEVVVQPALEPTVANWVGESGSIDLEWEAVDCVTTYKIYADGEFIDNTEDLSYTITGLEGETDYDILIEPISSCLCDVEVTMLTATTQPCFLPIVELTQVDTCFNTTMPAFIMTAKIDSTNGTPTGAGEWSGLIIEPDGTIDPSILNGPDSYTVTYTYTEGNCAVDLNTDVTFHAPPTVALESLPPGCTNAEMGMVIVTVEGGEPDFSYMLNEDPAQAENIFPEVPVGPYMIEVEDGNGCRVQMLDQIDNGQNPSAEIQGDDIVVEGENGVFELILTDFDSITIKNIVWYLNGENVCEGLRCVGYELNNATASGELYVEIEYGEDCLSTAVKEFEIKQVNSVYIPNMIDLSGTLGVPNNEWKAYIKGEQTFISHVHIFDRWGNMVRDYENNSMDYFKEFLIWDGFSGSVAREHGVYTYVIGLVIEGKTEIKYGNVTILR